MILTKEKWTDDDIFTNNERLAEFIITSYNIHKGMSSFNRQVIMQTQPQIHCIVVGNPIAHSKSPELHQAFARQTNINISYQKQLCPNDKDSFTAVVEAFFHGGGTGMNVTVPFKEMAFELCQQRGRLSAYATQAKAVNTLAMINGQLFGDNTDGRGLVNHLQQLNWPLNNAKVLLLGAGGASRGVLLPLIQAGVKSIHIANRTEQKAHDLLAELNNFSLKTSASGLDNLPFSKVDIVINATSIGLSTDNQLPFSQDLTASYAYDMMYGKPSVVLQHFEKQGAKISDGLGMLIHQGALSFELWTGKKVDMMQLGQII